MPDDAATGRTGSRAAALAVARRRWDRRAPGYDRAAGLERLVVGALRAEICQQAAGRTLELAIGTGRNLSLYPPDVVLTGVDLSPRMLAQTSCRAAQLGGQVDLVEAPAEELPFADRSFDTVLCTLGLCAVADQAAALAEAHRVLRPGGRLLLLDHPIPDGAPPAMLVRAVRWLISAQARRDDPPPMHFPYPNVVRAGLAVDARTRHRRGLLETVVAHRPA